MRERNILLLSELKHVDEITPFFSGHPRIHKEGYLIIPLNAEIEYVLTKKGISFESGREFRTKNDDPMVLSEKWSTTILDGAQWSFFRYREIELSQLYLLPLQVYFMSLFYYADVVSNIIARYPFNERLIVFPSTNMMPPTGFSLESHRIKTLVDVVITIAGQSNKEVLVPTVTMSANKLTHAASFMGKRILFGWGISILNTLVACLRRPRRIRILASDYWRNMAPYLRNLDSVEVMLVDRTEAFNAGLSNIFKFRMRFLHLDAYTQKTSSQRENAQRRIVKEWQSVRAGFPPCIFRHFSLQSLVVRVLDSIIDDAVAKSLKDIDDVYVLLTHLKPDVVELRTTISIQTHVGILAQVARVRGIPSLEMQHGIEYYGPGSMDRRHRAEYMGVYGTRTQKELRETGDSIKPIIIGSPRFDVYASLKKNKADNEKKSHGKIVFLCIAPPVLPGMATDTYDVEEYFQSIGFALREIPQSSVIIKLRSKEWGFFYHNAIASAFAGIPYSIADIEPIIDLYSKADAVVSCNSTAILEALQCNKPLVYLGLSARECIMGRQQFSQYAEQGALRIVTNEKELIRILKEIEDDFVLREDIARKAGAFLEREYSFDGHASERTAALIASLASCEPQQELL